MGRFDDVLGDELKALRLSRGLTRRQLKQRLSETTMGTLSLQTLATYELGTRHVSAERVYQICTELNEPIEELFMRVRMRVEGLEKAGLVLDIATTVRLPQPGLDPIRAWAEAMFRDDPQRCHKVTLTEAALSSLAELCQMGTAELIVRLTRAGLARDARTPDGDDASTAVSA